MDLNQNDFCHVLAEELQFHSTWLPSSILHLSDPILASIPKLMQKIARKCSISEIAFNCANFPPPRHPALQFHISLIPFVHSPSREILNWNHFYFPWIPGSVFNLRFSQIGILWWNVTVFITLSIKSPPRPSIRRRHYKPNVSHMCHQ